MDLDPRSKTLKMMPSHNSCNVFSKSILRAKQNKPTQAAGEII